MQLAQFLAMAAVPVLLAVTLHEAAHGWMARRLGDPTAYEAGRLTLNPIPHIDWLGTLVLPLALVATAGVAVGWAKPVPVNAARLRRPRQDMAWVAFAGPAANGLMLVGWALLARLALEMDGPLSSILFGMGQIGLVANAVLMLFNLLPVPPLDGANIVARWLPPEWGARWDAAGRYGLALVLGLLFLGIWTGVLTAPLMAFLGFAHHAFGLPWSSF